MSKTINVRSVEEVGRVYRLHYRRQGQRKQDNEDKENIAEEVPGSRERPRRRYIHSGRGDLADSVYMTSNIISAKQDRIEDLR